MYSIYSNTGIVGEPLNDEAWHWYNDVVGSGRCTVVDTWWQTGNGRAFGYGQLYFIETGGIMITPRPSSNSLVPKPGFPMIPFFGIDPVLLDDDVRSDPNTIMIRFLMQGQEIKGNKVSGKLGVRRPWPSMARTIYGDHQKFLDTYYKYPGKCHYISLLLIITITINFICY